MSATGVLRQRVYFRSDADSDYPVAPEPPVGERHAECLRAYRGRRRHEAASRRTSTLIRTTPRLKEAVCRACILRTIRSNLKSSSAWPADAFLPARKGSIPVQPDNSPEIEASPYLSVSGCRRPRAALGRLPVDPVRRESSIASPHTPCPPPKRHTARNTAPAGAAMPTSRSSRNTLCLPTSPDRLDAPPSSSSFPPGATPPGSERMDRLTHVSNFCGMIRVIRSSRQTTSFFNPSASGLAILLLRVSQVDPIRTQAGGEDRHRDDPARGSPSSSAMMRIMSR